MQAPTVSVTASFVYKIFGANNLEVKKYLTVPLGFKDRQASK